MADNIVHPRRGDGSDSHGFFDSPGFGQLGQKFGSIMDSIFGLTSDQDVEQQKKLMDYQSQLNAEQWERENAYNSPAQQMKRLREAGLNPDLAIGGNVSNTAGSSASTSLGSASSHPMSVVGLIDAFNNARLINANIQKAESEADFTQAQADEIRHRSKYKDIESESLSNLNDKLALFWNQKFSTEYQEGLFKALTNWSLGYRPELERDEEGKYQFNDTYFEREFHNLMQQPVSIITDVANEYHINAKDREYLDRMFESIVLHDKEAFDSAVRQFRSSKAVEQFKSENEVFQFIDYFVSKIIGSAQGITSAYQMYQIGRYNRRR